MSGPPGDELPEPVRRGLAGLSAAADQATLITSCDPDGFPRIALLSNSEISVIDRHRLRIALWAESTTCANLARDNRATLFRIENQAAYSIQLRCGAPLPLPIPGERRLVAVAARVGTVRADRVNYAAITSGLRFEVGDPDAVLQHWERVAQALGASDPPAPTG